MSDVTYTMPDMAIETTQTDILKWKSNDITELAKALSKAQSEIDGASKNSTNPFFKSNYADLHQVIKSSFPQLTKHGLSVVQGTDWIDGKIHVTTMLCHSSGQWIKSSVCMPLKTDKEGKDNHTAQDVGSIMTYGRRYGLSAMVGVAQYDDDAQSVSPPKPKKTKKVKPLSTEELNNTDTEIFDLDY